MAFVSRADNLGLKILPYLEHRLISLGYIQGIPLRYIQANLYSITLHFQGKTFEPSRA